MRKFNFFAIALAIMSLFALTSCSGALGKYAKKVSEYRDDVLVGESANFCAEAMSGYHENPFVIDGTPGATNDFLLVKISPKSYDPTAQHKYAVTVDGVEFTGDFVKHPFENTYSFEIAARASGSLSVDVDGEKIELVSVKTENFVSPEKAFEIALKRLSGCDVIKGGEYEIYIRLIANPVNASGGYFWYVAFVDRSGETCAVLIEPESMEIVAVRA